MQTAVHSGLVGIFCPCTKSLYDVTAQRDQEKNNASFNEKHTTVQCMKKAPVPKNSNNTQHFHNTNTSQSFSKCVLICFPAQTITAIRPDPANSDMCKNTGARD